MTTKKGPEALDLTALDAVTGGTGLRDMIAMQDGKTPTDNQSDLPTQTTDDRLFTSGGGEDDPNVNPTNDWVVGPEEGEGTLP